MKPSSEGGDKRQRNEKTEFLTHVHQPLKIKGKVLYQESAQAWNTIKIKRELLFLYPQLREKSSQISYTMILLRSDEEVMKQIGEIIEKDKIPILLFLEKDKTSSVSSE